MPTRTVMITFDIDGPSGTLQRAPETATRPSVISQGDFGPRVGVPRILELLAGHGVPATFFVPGWVAENYPEAVRSVIRHGHEIGHHGYLHEPPGVLGNRTAEAEILDRASAILQAMTGHPPLGYRSPAWDISRWTLDLLQQRGFLYDSSLMDHDQPYLIVNGRRKLAELPVHWALDDAPYYSFNPAIGRTGPLLSPQIALDTWLWEFDRAYDEGAAFMLTLHPYLSGRYSRLEALDRLLKHIRGRRNVEFKRCEKVARQVLRDRSTAGSRTTTRKARK
ncbi:MAG: polysaccharide deacetylase [SAR202 cluster bacterium]|nr:polysaccharide deacetylase [SAR202 cluster bacterium]